MYAFERLTNVSKDKCVDKADSVLESGWPLTGYPLLMLDQPIPWALEDEQLRSWNCALHCWNMLDPLLGAYSETEQQKYLQPCLDIALDWAASHVRFRELSKFSWYDMAVGLRCYRLAYILDASDRAGLLSREQKRLLWRSLKDHQKYLSSDRNINYRNNHGYYQVAGQLAMGRRFSRSSLGMMKAYRQGKQRLGVMLSQQFADDGMHKEHSPDYHRMVYETLKGLVDSGLVKDQAILDFADKIERALAWFVMPDRRLANLGDSPARNMARKPAAAEEKWNTEEMRHVVSGGKVGVPLPSTMAEFREGGYWVVKEPVSDPLAGYLVQNAAFHSRTHKHADDLSFIWFDRGREILVDAGRYGYIGKVKAGSKLWRQGYWYSDPRRIYCESTRAHNALEFDGLNYPRKGVTPYGSALGRTTVSQGIYAAETFCKQFSSIEHRRLLMFKPGKWLIVVDQFDDRKGRQHEPRQWFHFAPDINVQAPPAGFQATIEGDETFATLAVAPLLKGMHLSDLHHGETGKEGEPLQGWQSPADREMVANTAVNMSIPAAAAGSLATLFVFTDQLQVDTERAYVDPAGTGGAFYWFDNGRPCELVFATPVEGAISVTFSG